MTKVLSLISKRLAAILMMAIVVMGSMPISAFAALSVDLKANGQDNLTLATTTASFTLLLTATDATSCAITSPISSGIAPGAPMTIAPGSSMFPAAGASVTFTVSCTDGSGVTLSDSVVVTAPGAIAPSSAPTIDIKANGSDGPITINNGSTYTATWVSTNATACQMNPPVVSGVSLNGTTIAIGPGSPFYPAVSAPVTITITCTQGTINVSDSVVINLAPGGGGGGSPTVDVKANSSDGPVTINNGSTFTYTWSSANATACQQTPPNPTTGSGVSLSGTSVAIGPGHPFYPSVGSPTTITITCTNGTQNATDSVVIQLVSSGGGGGPTVDIKANGVDTTLTITPGETYVYTWTSANATACQMTTPVQSGVNLAGTSVAIGPGSPFYPPGIGQDVTITIVCTNGTQNATDSVIIHLTNAPGSGGGGGGSSLYPGEVLGAASCPWIHDYMRIDFRNDPLEVMKLQAFLKVYMGYNYVTINGVFDQATYNAVGAFQMTYRDEILTPWGHTAPTHYVYILTLKKVNELLCQQTVPLTADQQHEIAAFRNLIQTSGYASGPSGLRSNSNLIMTKEGLVPASGYSSSASSTTLTSIVPVTSTTTVPVEVATNDKGQIKTGLAAALFTFPDTIKDKMQCFYEFALILIVLYIFGAVLKDVLYSDLPENASKRFLAKWITISVGLLAALILAYILSEFCLLLPLLLSLLFSLIWMAFYPKHGSIRSTTKSWTTWKSPAGATVIK